MFRFVLHKDAFLHLCCVDFHGVEFAGAAQLRSLVPGKCDTIWPLWEYHIHGNGAKRNFGSQCVSAI